jgi:lipopolysaccharide export system ATP-binding protein
VSGAAASGAAATGVRRLVARDLAKSYGQRQVVDGVSLEVSQGEIVGLLGPNGAGKTTTFYMLVGLIRAERGQVILNDADVTHVPTYRRARLGIGYLPQEASIFRKLTAQQNLDAILEMTPLSREARRERRESLLSEFHLTGIRDRRAHLLSGGERRRVEIARALATDPAFILLDEPFTGVDPIAVSDIQDLIQHLKARGIGILLTDHSVRETLAITDRAYIIFDGKILTSGTSAQLPNDPVARKFYLGERFQA